MLRYPQFVETAGIERWGVGIRGASGADVGGVALWRVAQPEW